MKDINENVLNGMDIVFTEEHTIDFILNENYNNLIYDVSHYYASLLLDVKLNQPIGYSYYNNLFTNLDVEYMYDRKIDNSVQNSIDEIKYLSSLVLKSSECDILETFYKKTSYNYKELEMELRVYIDFIHYTIAIKIR